MKRMRILTLAALATAAIGGCQSIAGVEEVEFIEDGPSAASCDEYCDLVMEACSGNIRVYEDLATCEASCRTFNATDPSETGNTLACRIAQAKDAARADSTTEKSASCQGAGPGGGSLCPFEAEVPDCEGYCSLYARACKDFQDERGFDHEDQCVQRCGALEPAGTYSADEAPIGDTLACRLFYASRAALEPTLDNCRSGSIYPFVDNACQPVGEPDCDHYCKVVQHACVGGYEVYENSEQCKQVCLNTEPGTVFDSGYQDTVGCRTYHSYNALARNLLPHCSHSGPTGNGICSVTTDTSDANCLPYCHLAAVGCKSEFDKRFADNDECLADCSTIDGAVPNPGSNDYNTVDAQAGDTLQCRLLYVSRALGDSEHADDYCGPVFGDAPCVPQLDDD